jgi:hypothetical protein
MYTVPDKLAELTHKLRATEDASSGVQKSNKMVWNIKLYHNYHSQFGIRAIWLHSAFDQSSPVLSMPHREQLVLHVLEQLRFVS